MKSIFKKNWPKYLLQWVILAALIFFLSGAATKIFTQMEPADPERYCPMGGLEALATFFQRGSLPCSMSTVQIMMGIFLAGAVILFSKLFCSYICPVGTVEDLLIKLRKALRIKSLTIRNGGAADKILRIVKYALLFWIFYMTVSASELFCKNLDPYYATATGFKGEITLWMSLITVGIVVIFGLFVDRFWCRYVCPLGAISNTLKFWVWMIALAALCFAASLYIPSLDWVIILALFCIAGYLLEILNGKPRYQVLSIIRDGNACNGCGLCSKQCPYGISLSKVEGRLNHVDCTLCGDCIAACHTKALRIGVCSKSRRSCGFTKYLPAILALLLMVGAFYAGGKFEIPTIDEKWDVTEEMKLETVKIENLKSVKCYGSSMAFKARMAKIRGVHGVKTFVGSHTVVISYDPSKTTEDKIREEVFVPSNFRVVSPNPKEYSSLKYVTIRTEKMYDKMDLNYLGLQFRLTDKKIFGVESEYNCPLIVRVYMSPDEECDEDFFREVVNRKSLDMPIHGGGVKSTPVDFEFVRMDKNEGTIDIATYLNMMFKEFAAEYNGRYISPEGDTTISLRSEVYADKPQFIYEIVDQNYEKPIILRAIPFLSNHLSKEEGVIGTYIRLNKDLLPSLQVRFAAPMTADRIWELMNMEVWTITYSDDDVRQENARMKFDAPGTCYPYNPTE